MAPTGRATATISSTPSSGSLPQPTGLLSQDMQPLEMEQQPPDAVEAQGVLTFRSVTTVYKVHQHLYEWYPGAAMEAGDQAYTVSRS